MRPFDCIWASEGGARLEALSLAERLRLDDHFTSCRACRETARIGRELRELTTSHVDEPDVSTSRAVERALRAALGADRTLHDRRLPARAAWVVGGLAAAAAITAAVLVLSRSGDDKPTPRLPRQLVPQATKAAHATQAPQPRATATEIVSAAGPGTLDLGGVGTAVLDPATQVSWIAADRTLRLLDGRVDVEIAADPTGARPFRVATEALVVEVLGTRFTVSHREGRSAVRVARGRVRVVDLTGRALATLVAGEEYPVLPDTPALRDSAAAALGRARAQLAAGATAAARREARRALDLGPTRGERADAATIEAECALVEGDARAAADAYERAAARFANLPAGETALFAAGRARWRAGDRAGAIASWRRYLELHPQGRFATEATSRVRAGIGTEETP